jgi:putative redox protein
MSESIPGVPARKPSHVRATWLGEHLFDAGRPDGPLARIDGESITAQSPPDLLLSALATCSGIDVVDIMAKRRTPVAKLTVDVEGERREHQPRRFERLLLTFRIDGEGIDRIHAERAVLLAFEKYCTVAASLAPDIVSRTIVVLNGVAGEAVEQKMFTPG